MQNWFAALASVAAALSAGIAAPALAIVGPSSDAKSIAPYVVMVLQRAGSVAGFCSGIVLGPRVVLTAAHCVPAGAELRIHYKDADGRPVLLPVSVAVRHPGYRADAIRARKRSIDLALIRLASDLPARYRGASLGAVSAAPVGTAFRLAGFGVAREDDGASSGILRMTTLRARAPISTLLLWADDPGHRGAGACTGDSGGPVLDGDSDMIEAVMLWSAGEGSHACGALTQALWLGPQRPWIVGVLASWSMILP